VSTHSRKKAMLKRTVQWLAAGAVPFVITACYGPPNGQWPDDYDDDTANTNSDTASVLDDTASTGESVDSSSDTVVARLSGTVVDATGNGIGGILVSCLDAEGAELASGYTAAGDGVFEVELPTDCVTAVFEDEDGAATGGAFAGRQLAISEMAPQSEVVILSPAK
jgi:hypothetical protein